MSIRTGHVVEFAWSELTDEVKSEFNKKHPFSDPGDYRFYVSDQWKGQIFWVRKKRK